MNRNCEPACDQYREAGRPATDIWREGGGGGGGEGGRGVYVCM
jgi:hypothetical protein